MTLSDDIIKMIADKLGITTIAGVDLTLGSSLDGLNIGNNLNNVLTSLGSLPETIQGYLTSLGESIVSSVTTWFENNASTFYQPVLDWLDENVASVVENAVSSILSLDLGDLLSDWFASLDVSGFISKLFNPALFDSIIATWGGDILAWFVSVYNKVSNHLRSG